jgi:hypothetical protein
MAKYTELQRYPNSAAAYLVKSRLAQDGIPAAVRRGSRYQAMGGSGWVVSVPPDQLAQARAIIDSTNPEVDMDEYIDKDSRWYRRCPKCRSVMLERRPLSGWQRWCSVFTLGAGTLLLSKHFRCRKCGHTWHAR